MLDKLGQFENINEILDFDKFIAKTENKPVLLAFRKTLDDLGLSKTPTKFVTTRMNKILGSKKIEGYFRPIFLKSKIYTTLIGKYFFIRR